MAKKLIACRSCAKEVSRDAATCPSCGHPLKVKLGLVGCGSLVGLFFFAAAIYGGVRDANKPPPTQEEVLRGTVILALTNHCKLPLLTAVPPLEQCVVQHEGVADGLPYDRWTVAGDVYMSDRRRPFVVVVAQDPGVRGMQIVSAWID